MNRSASNPFNGSDFASMLACMVRMSHNTLRDRAIERTICPFHMKRTTSVANALSVVQRDVQTSHKLGGVRSYDLSLSASRMSHLASLALHHASLHASLRHKSPHTHPSASPPSSASRGLLGKASTPPSALTPRLPLSCSCRCVRPASAGLPSQPMESVTATVTGASPKTPHIHSLLGCCPGDSGDST